VYPLSPKRYVPPHIKKPDYATDSKGYPYSEMEIRGSNKIKVLTSEEIEKMRVVARVI
jgi:methionyl aminopeptidase